MHLENNEKLHEETEFIQEVLDTTSKSAFSALFNNKLHSLKSRDIAQHYRFLRRVVLHSYQHNLGNSQRRHI